MQTSYSTDMAVARRGQIADNCPVLKIDTFYNPQGEVKVGCLVTRGDDVSNIVHPDAAGEITGVKVVRGVVVASHDLESVEDGEIPGYSASRAIPVMRKGRIWVVSESAVTEGTSDVYARYTANGGDTQLGSFRAASGTGADALVPSALWKSSTSGTNELALLEIDL